MKKTFITIIVIGILQSHAQNTHVLYGERNLEKDTGCLYFDKDGLLYPTYKIPKDSFKDADYSLKEWYKRNENLFLEICKEYNCNFDKFSEQNCLILNDSICDFFLQRLNSSTNTAITFFIHGFRKPFTSINDDTDSPTDFNTLIKTFQKYNNSNSKIVEVYWDGLYDCCFSASSKNNEPLFQLFEKAQKNAENTGQGLKNILNSITKDTINIITHSLGAKVAIYGLLNMNNDKFLTPSNKRVNICLIAPAISPDLISKNYMFRNGSISFKDSDNYSLYIVYNEKDFVLKKKDNRVGIFGPGPYKYGNTTLGCNYDNAATSLNTYFKNNFLKSPIRIYNLNYVGRCHLVSCYCYQDNLKDTYMDMEK